MLPFCFHGSKFIGTHRNEYYLVRNQCTYVEALEHTFRFHLVKIFCTNITFGRQPNTIVGESMFTHVNSFKRLYIDVTRKNNVNWLKVMF